MELTTGLLQRFVGGQMAIQDDVLGERLLGEVITIEFNPDTSKLKVRFAWRTRLINEPDEWERCDEDETELEVSDVFQEDDGSVVIGASREIGYLRLPGIPILVPNWTHFV